MGEWVGHYWVDVGMVGGKLTIIQAAIPFTNNTHEPVAFVWWEESVTQNEQATQHLRLLLVQQAILENRASLYYCTLY